MTRGHCLRVLLVEDNPADADLILEGLESSGEADLEVAHVESLASGLEHLQAGPVDAVLLDLSLPGSRGLETFEALHDEVPSVPVVVLTGLDDTDLAAETVSLGAQDYLVKGRVDGPLISRTVRYAIERQRLTTDLARQIEKALEKNLELEKRNEELNTALERIQALEANQRALLETTGDAIIVVDERGRTRFANPMAEELFGPGDKSLVGQPLGVPIVRGRTVEIEVSRPEAQARTVEMRVTDLVWEDEPAYLLTLHEITERRKALLAFERAQKQQLELRDRFLSHVSHELRSPLTGIYQFVSILLRGIGGELSGEQRHYLEIALKNAHQLRDMISDLLEATRAEAGKLSVVPTEARLQEIVKDAVDALRESANEKEIELSTELAEGLPSALADPMRIRQVVTNLVENALKFTPRGGRVSVTVGVSKGEDGLEVVVTDTGAGLSDENREKIFERLYQAPNAAEAARKGLGLGLFICKEIIAEHGGRIWVESEEGKGSSFCFSVPRFSLKAQLEQVIRPIHLRLEGQPVLLSVEICRSDRGLLRPDHERTLDAAYKRLGGLLRSDDLLLPRIGGSGVGEVFFLVMWVKRRKEAAIPVHRIEGDEALRKALEAAGLVASASWQALRQPPKTSRRPVEVFLNTVARQVGGGLDGFRKRRQES